MEHKDSSTQQCNGCRENAPQKYLDVAEAASFLGNLKVSTIYALVHRREIPFRKHGTRLAFDPSELKVWSDKRITQVEPRATPFILTRKGSG